ncbi:MAG: NAD(P)/FAD-dependent oxidoreductase [Geminicoccaceae bacterium]
MSNVSEIIVIGAGIIGASIGYHLARRGADVTILDRSGPAAGATGKSFAWINANHVADDPYHRLRYQSLTEYHRLDQELKGALGVRWNGSLCFDVKDGALDKRLQRFRVMGYPVEEVSHNQFRKLEANYQDPPKRALRFSLEGCVEPIRANLALIDAAMERGGRMMCGVEVTGLRRKGEKVVGIETDCGSLDAESVVIAAGVGASDLVASIDLDLPMDNKPGLMLHCRPIELVLTHLIWGDRIHIKQQDDGRLIIGEIFSDDQGSDDQMTVAQEMLLEARRHLPDIDIEIEKTTIGMRPIPMDGMPMVGGLGSIQGLYIAVMHSGITLAPIMGRMVAEELLDGTAFEALAPYRPDRLVV